jgi:hypothetical protein
MLLALAPFRQAKPRRRAYSDWLISGSENGALARDI